MKRVLFTGDSITKGEMGCSYIELLKPRFPGLEILNLGQDGDTVSGIMKRTVAHLQVDNEWDLIVISAGHNDIILPEFMQKTEIHRGIVKRLKKSGSIPASGAEEFISTYKKFIADVRNITDATIILTTLSCLNEDLTSSTNEKRFLYNQEIRKLASENNIQTAEVAEAFNRILQKSVCRDYFMDNLFESVLFDRYKSKTVPGVDRLSSKRALHLTIDGIHLNSKGAEIYAEQFFPILKQLT